MLRRELRLYEGGLMNVTAIRNSVLKVNQLGYFKLNEEDPVEIDTDTESKKVNLVFKGDEADRTELQFGGGWSELDGFFGQFAINTKNFLGRGEQVGVSLQTGKLRDFFDLSYYVPWFLDRPQSIGIRAYDQSLEYELVSDQERYLRNSKGAVLTYGRNFRLFQSASISYNSSRYDDETRIIAQDPAVTGVPLPEGINPGDVITTRLEIYNSSLRPAYVFDSRDNPFEPTPRQATVPGGGVRRRLPGRRQLLHPAGGDGQHLPAGEQLPHPHDLRAQRRGGPDRRRSATDELSSLERFFLGGENSIRGHRFRSIFLRDDNGDPLRDPGGFILGGDSFIQFNLEYHFLLGGPFRVLLFADAGNVFGESQQFDLSNLRYTAGVELRVFLPVFGAPLRFIYAKNLDPLPQDSFEDFQFSIGTSF